MDMAKHLLTLIAPILAAVILGNLFLGEVKKARRSGATWYAPYLTLPGLMVLAALSIPVWIWLFT